MLLILSYWVKNKPEDPSGKVKGDERGNSGNEKVIKRHESSDRLNNLNSFNQLFKFR